MQLKTWLVVSLVVASSGCKIPQKPSVEIGVLDIPSREVITFVDDQEEPKRVPLESYDKATCFKPDAWEQVQVYIDLLEDYVRNRCK
jgi:hypothetical protein